VENNETPIPAGYMQDTQGRLCAIESIKQIDLARNDLVLESMKKATDIADSLSKFKGTIMGDIQAFCELSAEKYGAKLGGKKGNVTLYSFDGRFKMIRAIDDFITFDERLQAAKVLIDECLKRWSEGSNANLRTIVNDAFQVDKAGRINTNRVLGLRRIEIEDETWHRAMQAISESVLVVSSKAYVRFYERQPGGKYKQLNLNVAA